MYLQYKKWKNVWQLCLYVWKGVYMFIFFYLAIVSYTDNTNKLESWISLQSL